MNTKVRLLLRVVAGLALALVLLAGGYLLYLTVQYSRIPDSTLLPVENPQQAAVSTGAPLTAMTYNIGFGAYDPAFSFFMDEGAMLDGTPTKGAFSRAQSAEIVESNTAGAIGQAATHQPDFLLMQEVDTGAHRSFGINQAARVCAAFPQQASVFASNFHSAYLAYPLPTPHGAVESGLLTLSRYSVDEAIRRSLPVDTGFPAKYFDLDRCFTVLRLPVQSAATELVLINLHLSAYDEGGAIRAQQLEMLGAVLAEERGLGNWVVLGGDFNHALGGETDVFASAQQVPGWVFALNEADLPAGYRVVQADNSTQAPTCRGSDIPYTPGTSYTVVVDGFIVSDNITATARNIDTGFAYSDHNPVLLTFTLE